MPEQISRPSNSSLQSAPNNSSSKQSVSKRLRPVLPRSKPHPLFPKPLSDDNISRNEKVFVEERKTKTADPGIRESRLIDVNLLTTGTS